MNKKSRGVLEYLYRQKVENGIVKASLTELPNTDGVNDLVHGGYATVAQTQPMMIQITGKGIDWLKNNSVDDRTKILNYYYDHRTETALFTFGLDSTLGMDHAKLIAEAKYLVGKGLLEKVGKGAISGDMNLCITAYGIDEVEGKKTESQTLGKPKVMDLPTDVSITSDVISIKIRSEIYDHIKSFLDSSHYFTAVEEAYKVVRDKLKEITGEEAAAAVFGENALNNKHWEKIFGSVPEKDTPEGNFMRGTGYIHLGVQYLRNEKTHTTATTLDKNLALHYISLASLAYDLITRGDSK